VRPTHQQTFDECLREMFRRVGLRYTEKFCKQNDWYRKRSWSEGEENSFKVWVVDLLRQRYRWNKKQSMKEAGMFLLNYGWRFSPDGCLKVGREWRCR